MNHPAIDALIDAMHDEAEELAERARLTRNPDKARGLRDHAESLVKAAAALRERAETAQILND